MKLCVFSLILILLINFTSFSENCNYSAAKSTSVHFDEITVFDEYRNLRINDEKARLDNFLFSLKKDESLQGLVIFRLNKNDSRKKKLKRFNSLSKYFNTNEFGISRVSFVFIESEEESTRIYLPPSDLNLIDFFYFDKSENYKLIKARDLKQKINELFPKK